MSNHKIQALIFLLTIICISNAFSQKNPVAQFIRDNQEKCSFYLIKDGEPHGGFHELRSFPLASLSKTLIAIEFAYQVSEGKIDAEGLVPIYKLDQFAVYDNNYKEWLQNLQKNRLVNDNQILLKNIALGMIEHSVNTCADYLFSILGVDNVNQRIKHLGMEHHQEIFPFAASLSLAYNSDNVHKDTHVQIMNSLTFEEYHRKVMNEYNKFLEDNLYASRLSENFGKAKFKDEEYDDVWSGNFSRSTAVDYAELLGKINGGDYFPPEVQKMLQFLLEEWTMKDNPELADRFEAIAFKGAGTNSIVNVWVYLRDKQGKKAEFVALFNNLEPQERVMLAKEISEFAFHICTDASYLDDVLSHFDKFH